MRNQTAFYLPVYSLWKREIIRFVRDKHRLFGAIGQPLVLWVLVGSGLQASFQPAGLQDIGFLEYIYPGTLLLILLFTAIFSTISVVEDRREGFMQAVLVAPISQTSLVLGKVLGGTTLALFEGLVFLVLAFWVGIPLTPSVLLATMGFLFLIGLALTGLGFIIAWRMESTAGFHAVMNLFLMPMWLLSGAFFPITGLPGWLSWVMVINPLTYGMAGLRQVLYLGRSFEGLPGLDVCLGITALFALLTLVGSVRGVRKRPKGAG
ncbi:MAG: ABC transporter permease [bacterium]|nr:ABC transporter permease [bacterium]